MEENGKLKLDEKYMRAAIKQAQKAYAINETPIGCVIVYEGKIIGRGYNRRNTDKDPLAHAEIKAIKKASKKMGDWRLEQCTMYVYVGELSVYFFCPFLDWIVFDTELYVLSVCFGA